MEEASIEGRKLGIRVIPGAELSTRMDDCDVHMTSLFINCKNKQLIKRLDDMAASRQERNYKMVDKLHEAGFQIDRRDLDALGEGKILARGHIAQILIARGYATELKEALRKYLSKGTPGYVQKEVLSPEECIQLVHDAGGTDLCSTSASDRPTGSGALQGCGKTSDTHGSGRTGDPVL